MKKDEFQDQLARYQTHMRCQELSAKTMSKYMRDIERFTDYAGDVPICQEVLLQYKEDLLKRFKPSTVNSYLISINRYLSWLGMPGWRVRTLRVQKQFSVTTVLSQAEYAQLLCVAQQNGNQRNYLLFRTIASTGIRVSELQHITAEALCQGYAQVYSKGTVRNIILIPELVALLKAFCACEKIESGPVFINPKTAEPIHASSVWKMLKTTARQAGVPESKVYPHSLRHLFAQLYMEKVGNIFELADILGHSSTETTRIYARTSLTCKASALQILGL